MISPLCICRRCGRDGCRGRCRKACMRGTKARWGRVKFRVMFHKSGKKFGKFRASGFRTVHSASRLRRAGRVRYKWRDFSVVEHASGWRHGGGPAAGLAASRHPRRHRQQLHRCSGGLRQRAAPCLAGVPLQAQMLAAWRRPPRGVPVRPKCLGVIHSGRPFQARDAYDGCSRVRRPSGEPGLRVVARVDLCIAREKAFLIPRSLESRDREKYISTKIQ